MKNKLSFLLLIFQTTLLLSSLKAQTLSDAIKLSHNGNYVEAENIFNSLIKKDKNNTALLIASGFNNAWKKDYNAALNRFQQAIKLEPDNVDAAKGLAYTYLYKSDYIKASIAFNNLTIAYPGNEEYHFALGLCYLNMQKNNKAYHQFTKVLEINKSNKEALMFIEKIRSAKGIIEFSVLAGLSGSGDENKFGLRQAQAGYQINSNVVIYGRYDNSLSLDNYSFMKNNLNTNAYIGGIYTRWHYRVGSKFEYGYRSLPGKQNQRIYQTEQVIFLPKNFIFKLGGSIITSNKLQNEWMLMSSISIPAGKKIQIEPHYYFIHRISDEHRFLLNIGYRFSPGSDIAIGAFNGTEKNSKLNIDNKVYGAYAYSNIHIKGPFFGTLLARYEKDSYQQNSFIAAAGFRIALQTKK